MNSLHIDQSVYPDLDDPPVVLETDYDKAEYVDRICAAWDFGIHPDAETFDLFRGWKDIFDRFPVVSSPAYHAMRAWFGWEAMEYPKGIPAPTPQWVHLDRLEGRGKDPCEHLI